MRSLNAHWDIVHFHWPELELNISSDEFEARSRLNLKMLAIDSLRAAGTLLVWTVHNLESHEQRFPELERQFWSDFIGRVDGFIALTAHGRELALERFPKLRKLPAYVIPHGHYRDYYPVGSVDLRKQFGILPKEKVFLFFGKIRPYKNVPALIRAFSEMRQKATLIVAGEPNSHWIRNETEIAAAGKNTVVLQLQRIPDDMVTSFFRASDLVVLPYKETLNSGVAILALSLNRPVFMSDRAATGGAINAAGLDWVRTFDRDISGRLLDQVWKCMSSFSCTNERPPSGFEWHVIARETELAFLDLMSRRR